MIDDLDSLKRTARQAALAARAGCDPVLGARLTEHVLRVCPPPSGTIVAGFWPLPGEIDIRGLLETLHRHVHTIALPVTPPSGEPLAFRRWSPGTALRPGRFGTLAPDGDEVRPDWLFVPLLAFDRRGHRLGYGGGYYDRTLAALPDAVAIGCAFAAQEVAEVPAGPNDVKLAGVATEREAFWCGRNQPPADP